MRFASESSRGFANIQNSYAERITSGSKLIKYKYDQGDGLETCPVFLASLDPGRLYLSQHAVQEYLSIQNKLSRTVYGSEPHNKWAALGNVCKGKKPKLGKFCMVLAVPCSWRIMVERRKNSAILPDDLCRISEG